MHACARPNSQVHTPGQVPHLGLKEKGRGKEATQALAAGLRLSEQGILGVWVGV